MVSSEWYISPGWGREVRKIASATLASTSEKGAGAGKSPDTVSRWSEANEKEAKEVIKQTKFSQAPKGALVEAQCIAKTGLGETPEQNTRRPKGFQRPGRRA